MGAFAINLLTQIVASTSVLERFGIPYLLLGLGVITTAYSAVRLVAHGIPAKPVTIEEPRSGRKVAGLVPFWRLGAVTELEGLRFAAGVQAPARAFAEAEAFQYAQELQRYRAMATQQKKMAKLDLAPSLGLNAAVVESEQLEPVDDSAARELLIAINEEALHRHLVKSHLRHHPKHDSGTEGSNSTPTEANPQSTPGTSGDGPATDPNTLGVQDNGLMGWDAQDMQAGHGDMQGDSNVDLQSASDGTGGDLYAYTSATDMPVNADLQPASDGTGGDLYAYTSVTDMPVNDTGDWHLPGLDIGAGEIMVDAANALPIFSTLASIGQHGRLIMEGQFDGKAYLEDEVPYLMGKMAVRGIGMALDAVLLTPGLFTISLPALAVWAMNHERNKPLRESALAFEEKRINTIEQVEARIAVGNTRIAKRAAAHLAKFDLAADAYPRAEDTAEMREVAALLGPSTNAHLRSLLGLRRRLPSFLRDQIDEKVIGVLQTELHVSVDGLENSVDGSINAISKLLLTNVRTVSYDMGCADADWARVGQVIHLARLRSARASRVWAANVQEAARNGLTTLAEDIRKEQAQANADIENIEQPLAEAKKAHENLVAKRRHKKS
jgi:hypothetical protein